MAVFIIMSVVLAIIALLLFCPVCVELTLRDSFFAKVKFLNITFFNSEKQEKKAPVEKPQPPAEKRPRPEGFFERLKAKKGFAGAVKDLAKFAGDILKRAKSPLSHTHIRHFTLDITVASDNAANTAVEYGAVCSTVYPAVSAVCSLMKVRINHVNVYSDFERKEPEFYFSASVRLRVIFALQALWGIFKEYQNFKMRNEL